MPKTIGLLLLLVTLPALGQTSVKVNVPDVLVIDQTGAARHFYSDLVKDRVVVMNFIFTSCTTICPTMGATFSRVQRLLGDRNVTLISISVDPVTDTPQRLDAWSRKLDARPGWTLVTGDKPEIDRLLKSLGVFTPSRETHTPTLLIGNARNGRWQRASGFTSPATSVSLIDQVSGSQK
jgi:cytochrome oxidase Cu insertion factor (SCO1/SenC/PrrC family)